MTFTDQLGRPIEVDTKVVPVGANGAVLWSRSGRVVSLGRTLVRIKWTDGRTTTRQPGTVRVRGDG